MSQREMAERLSTDERTIRRWEAVDVDPSPMATSALRRLMAERGVTDAEEEGEKALPSPSPSPSPPSRVKLRGILPSLGSS